MTLKTELILNSFSSSKILVRASIKLSGWPLNAPVNEARRRYSSKLVAFQTLGHLYLVYGSDTIHLLFNIWYREFKYDPAYDNNLPQVDHIFPQVELKLIKEKSADTG